MTSKALVATSNAHHHPRLQTNTYTLYAPIVLLYICILTLHPPALAQHEHIAVPSPSQSQVTVNVDDGFTANLPTQFVPNQQAETIFQEILRMGTQSGRFSVETQVRESVGTSPSYPYIHDTTPYWNIHTRNPITSPTPTTQLHSHRTPHALTDQLGQAPSHHSNQSPSLPSNSFVSVPEHSIRYMQKFLPNQYLQVLRSDPTALRLQLESMPASDRSDPSVLLARGLMNITGLGGKRDIQHGFELIEQTANDGDAYALDLLGDLYLHGVGTIPDASIALRHYERAEPMPVHVAEKIGDLYESGNGTTKNLDIAMQYYEAGYSGGSTSAAVKLADLYLQREPSSEEVNRAFDLYKDASTQGNILATVRIADMHLAGQAPQASTQRALELYLDVTRTQGIVDHYSLTARNEARTKAGELLMAGEAVERDPNSALQLWLQAGKEGYASATRNLGIALRDGNGVQQNSFQAIRVLRAAEDQGSSKAKSDADNLVVQLCNERSDNSCLPIPVFYATTRTVNDTQNGTVAFGVKPDSSGRMHFGISWWPIPNDRDRDDLNWLNFEELGQNVDTWISRLQAWYWNTTKVHINSRLDEMQFHQRIGSSVADEGMILFIHGYNNTFDEAVQRAAQFTYDTSFAGPTVVYSWPSQGGTEATAGYTIDDRRQDADCTSFVRFLSNVEHEIGINNRISIVAHSMGSRLIFSALTACENSGEEIPPEIDLRDLSGDPSDYEDRDNDLDVLFAAPDIHTKQFEKYAREVSLKVNQMTIYASAKDKALRAGMEFLHGGEDRLGVGGTSRTVISGVHTIDASHVESESILQHAYVFRQRRVTQDAGEILRQRMEPDCRTWPIRQDFNGLPYWILDSRKDPPVRSDAC